MERNRKLLSQAEVWDDSALLQSWDDALAEYKLYHSIHARGERVEDLIKEDGVQEEDTSITEDDLRQATAGMQTNGISSEKLEDGELDEEPETVQAQPNGDSADTLCVPSTSESEHKQRLANANTVVDQPEKPWMPNAVISGVKDKTLKNLMMSWYYAGYYTGFYEGQQQVQSHTPKQDR